MDVCFWTTQNVVMSKHFHNFLKCVTTFSENINIELTSRKVLKYTIRKNILRTLQVQRRGGGGIGWIDWITLQNLVIYECDLFGKKHFFYSLIFFLSAFLDCFMLHCFNSWIVLFHNFSHNFHNLCPFFPAPPFLKPVAAPVWWSDN